jgi:hypothetical protein
MGDDDYGGQVKKEEKGTGKEKQRQANRARWGWVVGSVVFFLYYSYFTKTFWPVCVDFFLKKLGRGRLVHVFF